MNIREFRKKLNKLATEYADSVKLDNRWDNRMFLAEMELLEWAQSIQHMRNYPGEFQ